MGAKVDSEDSPLTIPPEQAREDRELLAFMRKLSGGDLEAHGLDRMDRWVREAGAWRARALRAEGRLPLVAAAETRTVGVPYPPSILLSVAIAVDPGGMYDKRCERR